MKLIRNNLAVDTDDVEDMRSQNVTASQTKELENCYNKQFKDVYEAINFLLKKDKQQKVQNERKRIGFKND